MSSLNKIEGLEAILANKLPLNTKILKYEIQLLTKPGDNYGSEMLSLTLDLQYSNGTVKNLNLVAKRPPKNEQLLSIFQTSRTFIKENCFYTVIIPKIYDFEREVGVPEDEKLKIFCDCYGARISLSTESNEVDQDAMLLLENLKPKQFRTGNRLQGFDTEHSKLILKGLAQFHATTLALKLIKPNTFKDFLIPYIDKIDIDAGMTEDGREKMIDSIKDDVKKVCPLSMVKHRLIDQIKRCIKRQKKLSYSKDHPFVTAIHNDFWVNNIMIGYEEKDTEIERPISLKILDFQLVSCDSVVHDVLFFILTSMKDGCFESFMDMWLKYYHEQLINRLHLLKCPLQAFTYEKFMSEVYRCAPWEFYHIVSMLKVVFARQDVLPESLDALNDEIFGDSKLVGAEYYQRLQKVVQIYIDKHWVI
uniref:CSON005181 protein n=1 Tax=Culicoides sonorensis TaxID=179676 RepID=A0A336LYH8_CULSO